MYGTSRYGFSCILIGYLTGATKVDRKENGFPVCGNRDRRAKFSSNPTRSLSLRTPRTELHNIRRGGFFKYVTVLLLLV